MPFLTITTLLNWMWQSTLCLGACWLLYQLLLRQERCFHYNRRFLLLTPWLAAGLTLLLAVAAPLLTSWLPASIASTGLLSPALTLPTVTVGAPATTAPSAWWWLPALLYVAGVALWIGRASWQLLGLWHLARLLPRHRQAGYTQLLTGGKLPVSSFGQFIFWDETAELTPAEARQVLHHELVHVQQRHTQERLLLELVRALLWFNPFVHFYPRALNLTHEYIADAAVLEATPSPEAPTVYAALLARLTLRRLHPHLPLTQSFTQSQTLTRIAMLHSSRSARRWKQWLVLPVSAGLLFTVACEQAAVPASPTPATASTDSEAAPLPPTLAPEAPVPPPPPVVYQYVEQMPEYQGGMEKLLTDLTQQLRYPQAALAAKVQGRLFVSFIVTEDGSVQAVKLFKGLTAPNASATVVREMEEAAMAAVRNLPGNWTPGKQNGQAVAVAYTIPVNFALQQAKVTLPNKSAVPITYPASQQQ